LLLKSFLSFMCSIIWQYTIWYPGLHLISPLLKQGGYKAAW
jgi:hypothetical protein